MVPASAQNSQKTFLEEFPSLEGVLELVGDDFRTVSISRSSIDFKSANIDDNLNKLSRDLKLGDVVRKRWVLRMEECMKTGSQVKFDFDRNIDDHRLFFSVTMNYKSNNAEGNPQFAYILRDITSIKRSEQELLESKNRMQLAEEFGNIGTWEWDLSSDVIIWSATTQRMFGAKPSPSGYTLQSFLPLVIPEDRETLIKSLEKSINLQIEHHAEFRIHTEDRGLRWVEGRGRGVYDQNNVCTRMLGVVFDITERKVFEQTLQDQRTSILYMSKMSALGEMAGAIAHEVNNPLTVIRGKAAVIKNDLRADRADLAKLCRDVEEIDAMASRIAKIVEGMRFFSRDGSCDSFMRVPLIQILNEVLAICSERFKTRGIDLKIPSVLPTFEILCQPVQIGQVFINLLNNAYDAVENSVKKAVTLSVHSDNHRAHISVSDTGCGISDEIKTKIFQPFFTTKAATKGTGIGLSIVDGIVRSHKGTVSVESTMGITRFTVSLPLVLDPQEEVSNHAES